MIAEMKMNSVNDILQSNAVRHGGLGPYALRRVKTHPVVLNNKLNAVLHASAKNPEQAPAAGFGFQTVEDGVFHNGLEQELNRIAIPNLWLHVNLYLKGMGKGVLLYEDIIVQQVQFHIDGDKELGVGEGIFH